MTTRKNLTIAETIRALPEEVEVSSASHLSFDLLLSYHRKEISAEEEERIEAHFARCRRCTEQSIELAQFLDPGEEPAQDSAPEESLRELTRSETDAIWKGLQGRLPKQSRIQRQEAVRPSSPRPSRVRWRENPRVLQAVAAVLLAVAVAAPFAVWKSAQLQRARLLEAEPNVPVLNLEAAAFRRDAGQPPPPPALALPGTLLILVPEREPVSAEYTVAILTQDGKQIWSNPGLRPTDLGQFHLRLPRNLSPGVTYRIRILYPKQDHAEELRVQITSPASP